jgi:hypothetical protein
MIKERKQPKSYKKPQIMNDTAVVHATEHWNAFVKPVNARLVSALLAIISGMLVLVTGFAQTPTAAALFPSEIKTVVDMSDAELLKSYHKELSNVEFSPARISDDKELDWLLEKVGDNVETFFQDFSNTTSREQVHMQACRPGMSRCIDRTKEFNYLILPHSGISGIPWQEARTDKNHNPVDEQAIKGFCISSGYAFLSMYLHPSHQRGSRFRYLGRENKKPHSHVIAFAQKPEVADYLASYFDVNLMLTTRLLVQGFVWLDPESCQITRMITTLLLCQPDNFLQNQTTDIHYRKVTFEDGGRQFWLPGEVKVSWELPYGKYMNQHRYSDFHLFAVESDYQILSPASK